MSSRYRKRRPVCDPLLIQLMLALPARILQLDVQVLVVGIALGKGRHSKIRGIWLPRALDRGIRWAYRQMTDGAMCSILDRFRTTRTSCADSSWREHKGFCLHCRRCPRCCCHLWLLSTLCTWKAKYFEQGMAGGLERVLQGKHTGHA